MAGAGSNISLNTLKRRARELLGDIPDVRGIGVGWDSAGQQVLQVDLGPETDRSIVEKRLGKLNTNFKLRMVSGKIGLDSGLNEQPKHFVEVSKTFKPVIRAAQSLHSALKRLTKRGF
jgi:hypothetical protein